MLTWLKHLSTGIKVVASFIRQPDALTPFTVEERRALELGDRLTAGESIDAVPEDLAIAEEGMSYWDGPFRIRV